MKIQKFCNVHIIKSLIRFQVIIDIIDHQVAFKET